MLTPRPSRCSLCTVLLVRSSTRKRLQRSCGENQCHTASSLSTLQFAWSLAISQMNTLWRTRRLAQSQERSLSFWQIWQKVCYAIDRFWCAEEQAPHQAQARGNVCARASEALHTVQSPFQTCTKQAKARKKWHEMGSSNLEFTSLQQRQCFMILALTFLQSCLIPDISLYFC